MDPKHENYQGKPKTLVVLNATWGGSSSGTEHMSTAYLCKKLKAKAKLFGAKAI